MVPYVTDDTEMVPYVRDDTEMFHAQEFRLKCSLMREYFLMVALSVHA